MLIGTGGPGLFRRWKQLRGEDRGLTLYYIMLHAAVACMGIYEAFQGRWSHAGLCLLALALFSLPSLAADVLKLRVEAPLDIAVTLFVVCADLCGEVLGFYLRFPWWDAALHVIWGFLGGLLGCAFLEALQGSRLRAPAAALAALGFAALSSILWEFFEFSMDALFHMDMQKDAWLQSVSSVLLNPEGRNIAVTAVPETVAVDGALWPGLLDIGLLDTIGDLFLGFLGSLGAALALLPARRPKLLRGLMPVPLTHKEGKSDETE